MRKLYLMYSLELISIFMFRPYFVAYIQSLGGSHFRLGLILSSGYFISFIWNPIVGSMSDIKGRKRILTQSLIFCLIGNILMSLSSNLEVIFVARLICALGGQIPSLIKALISDEVKSKDEKSKSVHRLLAVSSISLMFGSVLGGFLSECDNGMRFISAVISVIIIINIAITNILTYKEKPKTDRATENSVILTSFSEELKLAAQYLKSISWPKYWDIFLIKGFMEFGFSIAQLNFVLILKNDLDKGGRHIGFLFTLISVTSMVTNIVLFKLKEKFYGVDDGYRRLLHGTTFLTIAFLGLGIFSLYPMFYIFVLFLAVIGISRPLCESSLQELLTSKTSDSDRGSVMCVYDNILPATGLIAPIVSGVIADIYGERIAVLLCAIPATLGYVLAYYQKCKTD